MNYEHSFDNKEHPMAIELEQHKIVQPFLNYIHSSYNKGQVFLDYKNVSQYPSDEVKLCAIKLHSQTRTAGYDERMILK